MRADYLTYKRATGVSLGGLVLQAAFASITLIYGILGKDHAAITASVFMGVGVLAWLTLAIVYDQHRRERIEAMEAESLAGERAGTSVFESRGEEFRVAAKRLASLYRFFVPGMSIVIGVLLLAGAIWRFRVGTELVEKGHFVSSKYMEWGLAIGLGLAAIAFVFARFTSGMAKQSFWANLRAGSSFAVGSSVLGLAIAVVQFVDLITAEDFAFLRYMQVAVPVFLGVAAVEIFLNFVLDIYRPRKPGELPRPAFDSRLLGLIAAPDQIAKSISDAINYQLGFNVTSGWFYQLLSRSLWKLIVAGVGVMWVLSSLVVLQPHQRGTILRFGRPVRENMGPGLHAKLPWPIDEVYIPEYFTKDDKGRVYVADRTTTGVRVVQLATSPPANTDPILWTNEHVGEEVFQLVRAGDSVRATDGGDAVTELSLVSVEIPLKYSVADVALFDGLAPAEQREELLKAVAQREITQFFQGVSMDDVLGPKRVELSEALRQRVDGAFKKLNPGPDGAARGGGVSVIACGIVGAHPPRQADVAANFEKVVEADQKYQARMFSARAEEIKLLTQAAGSVEGARTIITTADEMEASKKAGAGAAARVPELERKLDQLLDAAGGEAAVTIASAKAARWERHMGDRARAVRYAGQLAAFQAAPNIFTWNLYLDTLARAVSRSRVYITSDQISNLHVRAELQDKDTGMDVFHPKQE